MPLFEVAILRKAVHKKGEETAPEALIFGPKPIVAKDQKTAELVAASEAAQTGATDVANWEVLSRPFK